mmetsp:Transcript_65257/g.103405  ORF Transcript_65257/g.103405 Transcript_65257/m.103405 type:complete len:165 (+) Transcript_65257:55-549(+)
MGCGASANVRVSAVRTDSTELPEFCGSSVTGENPTSNVGLDDFTEKPSNEVVAIHLDQGTNINLGSVQKVGMSSDSDAIYCEGKLETTAEGSHQDYRKDARTSIHVLDQQVVKHASGLSKAVRNKKFPRPEKSRSEDFDDGRDKKVSNARYSEIIKLLFATSDF